MAEAVQARRPVRSFVLDFFVGLAAYGLFNLLVRYIEDPRLAYAPTIIVFGLAGLWRAASTRAQRVVTALLLFAGGVLPFLFLLLIHSRMRRAEAVFFIVNCGLSISAGIAMRLLLRRQRGAARWLGAWTVLLVVLVAEGPGWSERLNYPMIDKPVSAMQLQTMDGQPFDFGSLKGQVVVFDFWASWCGPCMRELPVVLGVEKRFHADRRVTFVLANSGSGLVDNPAAARAYLQSHQIKLTSVRWSGDRDAFDRALRPFDHDPYGGIPALFVLDKHGRVRWFRESFDSESGLNDRLQRVVETLLAEPETK